MATTPRRARRADAARNAERLLAAARDLFDEYGVDVALDEVARRAGVGNATLYRHFPTRGDLLLAVYADEVAKLCDEGAALLREPEAGSALFTWLESLAVHIATRQTIAHAGTGNDQEHRTELFARWHGLLTSTAQKLLTSAQESGAVHTNVTVSDLLALTSAIAMANSDQATVRRLLALIRQGLATP